MSSSDVVLKLFNFVYAICDFILSTKPEVLWGAPTIIGFYAGWVILNYISCIHLFIDVYMIALLSDSYSQFFGDDHSQCDKCEYGYCEKAHNVGSFFFTMVLLFIQYGEYMPSKMWWYKRGINLLVFTVCLARLYYLHTCTMLSVVFSVCLGGLISALMIFAYDAVVVPMLIAIMEKKRGPGKTKPPNILKPTIFDCWHSIIQSFHPSKEELQPKDRSKATAELIDIIIALAATLLSTLFIFWAAFDRNDSPDKRILFAFTGVVPLEAVALYGASACRRRTMAKFGAVLAFVMVVISAGLAGIILAPIFGEEGHPIDMHHMILTFHAIFLFILGIFVGQRSLILYHLCCRECEQDNVGGMCIPEHFGHLLAWAQAFALFVFTLDIAVKGGPQERPFLTCVVGVTTILPIYQEIMAPKNVSNTFLAHCIHTLIETSVGAIQIVVGFILPIIQFVTASVFNIRSGNGTSTKTAGKFMSVWLQSICHFPDEQHEFSIESDCLGLQIRTYVAMSISVAACYYAAHWSFMKCYYARRHKIVTDKMR